MPFKELPLLEVRLPDAVPEAFDMVLNYIYTDRIDPTKKSKCIWFCHPEYLQHLLQIKFVWALLVTQGG